MVKLMLLLTVCAVLTFSSCVTALPQREPSFEPIDENTNLYLIAENGMWGYIDQSGDVRIQPQFDNATNFKDGVAVVYIDQKCFLIDREGVVFHDTDIQIGLISEGMVAANNEGGTGKTGFITTDGELVIDFKFDITLGFSEGLALVHVDKMAGYINKSGDFVIPPQFGQLSYSFNDGFAKVIVREGEFKGHAFINKKGEVAFDTSFDYTQSFSEGLAKVYDYDDPNGSQKYITTEGEIAFYLEGIYQADNFSEDLLLLFNGNTATILFVDRNGLQVFDKEFKDARKFSEGKAAVLVDGKWGYIDKTGAMIIEPKYDRAHEFNNGLAQVVLDGKWAYIDENGEYIWGPEEPGVD